ncbi:hypothetical protein [Novipirellula rosea]|uniref:YubB ferredoxin-like domain-containing protein n=1 Tax=Novipirellula rosea TaxID=1031540 RepID=A0ABP8M6F2_9BACT
MTDFFNCMICASGSSYSIDQIQSLINEHTHANDDDDGEYTYFEELTDSSVIGYRWRSIEGEDGNEVLWGGQLSSFPGSIAEQLSLRFPDVTIKLKFTLDHDDYAAEEGIRVVEYKRGEGRLTYHCYEHYEFDATETEPIEHWLVSLSIADKAQGEKVVDALVRDGILEIYGNEYLSYRRSDDVLPWLKERFPDVKIEIAYWRPYHLQDADAEPKHFIGVAPAIPDRTQQVKTYRF